MRTKRELAHNKRHELTFMEYYDVVQRVTDLRWNLVANAEQKIIIFTLREIDTCVSYCAPKAQILLNIRVVRSTQHTAQIGRKTCDVVLAKNFCLFMILPNHESKTIYLITSNSMSLQSLH